MLYDAFVVKVVTRLFQANFILPSAIAGIVDSTLYSTTFYLALIRPVFEFFGLLCAHFIRESAALLPKPAT